MNMQTNFQNNIKRLKEILKAPKKIIILAHQNPDGDAMSSSLGLTFFLKKYNHQAQIILPNEYHEFLKWLPGSSDIILFNRNKDIAIELIESAQVIFCLDFNELARIDKIEPFFSQSKAFKVLIDHHPNPKEFCDITFSDISVCATAEYVYKIISELDDKNLIDKTIAECLFTGIMTDTGCFSFNSSNPETYAIVAKMLDFGINKDMIVRKVFDNFSADRMRLMGYCLNEKMVIDADLKIGYISLCKDEMKKYNFTTGDSEGFVNLPLSIKGINFSALFIEKDDKIKMSFRSRGDFDVNSFARKHFNGGGHKNASGGKAFKSLENTLKEFTETIKLYKDELNYDF